jgi:hypothetical protein
MVRKISDEDGRPTILYDEVDALFTNKGDAIKADLLAALNAGHRNGATFGRCFLGSGKGKPKTEDLPVYAALALAGLRKLPDALGTRSIFIEMRKRAPDEVIEQFRHRIHKLEAEPIFHRLVAWCAYTSKRIAGEYPDLPPEVVDRDADCWEGLLAIADAAGGDWPKLAREAAVFLVGRGKEQTQSDGIDLLAHIRDAFMQAEKIWTSTLLERLCNRDESPWADMGRGKGLTDRGLAERLKPYRVKSKQVKLSGINQRGYDRVDFTDLWNRYLDPVTAATSATNLDKKNNLVEEVAEVADGYKGNGKDPTSQNEPRRCPRTAETGAA